MCLIGTQHTLIITAKPQSDQLHLTMQKLVLHGLRVYLSFSLCCLSSQDLTLSSELSQINLMLQQLSTGL